MAHRLAKRPLVPPALLAATVLVVAAAPAAAHGGPDGAWVGWTWDPLVILPLALAALAYAGGLRKLWSAARPGSGVARWQVAAFAAGWLLLALALVSPLDRLGEAYFSIHMVQHQAMMLLAAPLIVLGSPAVALLWSLPPAWRRRAGRVARWRSWGLLSRPASAWVLYALVLWAWHAPRLYEAALADTVLHILQHASFLAAALLFWWAAFDRRGGVAGRSAAILGVAVTAVHSSILGALMTFATRPWYGHTAAPAVDLPLTPLEDQQLAGLIMWVPGGLVHLLAGAALAAVALREAEIQARRAAGRRAVPLGAARLDG